MAIYVANNGQLQTIKGIYYGMAEDYINATLFHNLVPKTATEIKFLYSSDNPDLTGYQRIGYADNNNFIEVWNNGTKYILINPKKNYIYAPVSCYEFLREYVNLHNCIFDNFDTRDTTSMVLMFYECEGLTRLDVTGFDTQNVANMSMMFGFCRNIITLDLSHFNTQNVTNMKMMFDYCDKLKTIISNSFNIISLKDSTSMFNHCTSLVGGNGTTYSSSHNTAEYARVDGEDGLPGYFTAPN